MSSNSSFNAAATTSTTEATASTKGEVKTASPREAFPPAEWALRVDLAAAYRECHNLGLNEGIDNHLTCVVPSEDVENPNFLVIPYGLMWSEVKASDLLLMDSSGKILKGEGEPDTTAFMIHSRMHVKLGDKGHTIMHTHMPHASALW